MKVIADTGPLLAAANSRDQAHGIAASLVTELGRDLLVCDPVIVEVDQLLRSRVSGHAARLFLAALSAGEHTAISLSPALRRRAIEIDAKYADLDLGYADASVMAIAERERLPILTFDFADFRATQPSHGHWQLVIDEHRYRDHVDR